MITEGKTSVTAAQTSGTPSEYAQMEGPMSLVGLVDSQESAAEEIGVVPSSLVLASQEVVTNDTNRVHPGSSQNANQVMSTTTDSESNFDVPPSGTVACITVSVTVDECHFNILKERYSCKK